jgi:hypothetical protein
MMMSPLHNAETLRDPSVADYNRDNGGMDK